MSGIDTANWYQADFTTLQPKNYCYWKSLFHWLLDIALTNSYLLAKASHTPRIGESKDYYSYQWFLEALVKVLMRYHETPEHNQILRSTRIYCIYCWKDQLNWKPKHQWQQQSFDTNLTNIGGGYRGDYRGQFRGSKTSVGCDQCNVPLCKIGDCWCLWHEKFN